MSQIVKCPVEGCKESYPVHSLMQHVQQYHNLPKAKIVMRHNVQNELFADLRPPDYDSPKYWFKRPKIWDNPNKDDSGK
jgi:hypothetical protein